MIHCEHIWGYIIGTTIGSIVGLGTALVIMFFLNILYDQVEAFLWGIREERRKSDS